MSTVATSSLKEKAVKSADDKKARREQPKPAGSLLMKNDSSKGATEASSEPADEDEGEEDEHDDAIDQEVEDEEEERNGTEFGPQLPQFPQLREGTFSYGGNPLTESSFSRENDNFLREFELGVKRKHLDFSHPKRLTVESLTLAGLKKFRSELITLYLAGYETTPNICMTPEAYRAVESEMLLWGHLLQDSAERLTSVSMRFICNCMVKLFAADDQSKSGDSELTPELRFGAIKVHYGWRRTHLPHIVMRSELLTKLQDAQSNCSTRLDVPAITKILTKNLIEHNRGDKCVRHIADMVTPQCKGFTLITEWWDAVEQQSHKLTILAQDLKTCVGVDVAEFIAHAHNFMNLPASFYTTNHSGAATSSTSAYTASTKKKGSRDEPSIRRRDDDRTFRQARPCDICGNVHESQACQYEQRKHPDRNTQRGVPFALSDKGKEWFAKGHTKMRWNYRIDGSPFTPDRESHADDRKRKYSDSKGSHYGPGNTASSRDGKSKCITCAVSCCAKTIDDASMSCSSIIDATILAASDMLHVKILIDTGALQSRNYVSTTVAQWLCNHGSEVSKVSGRVVPPFNGAAGVEVTDSVQLTICYLNELTNSKEILKISCLVLPLTPQFDIIVGFDTTLQHNLIEKLVPCLLSSAHKVTEPPMLTPILLAAFCSDNDVEQMSPIADQRLCDPARSIDISIATLSGGGEEVEMGPRRSSVLQHAIAVETAARLNPIPVGAHFSRDVFFPKESAQMDLGLMEPEPFDNTPQSEPEDIAKLLEAAIYLNGPSKDDMRSMLLRYLDVFDTRVRSTAAAVEPMSFKCHLEQLQLPKNKCRAREQGADKQAEIDKQVKTLLDAGVISYSSATHHSQVLMVPKPAAGWRFCLDFRNLNAACDSAGFPLPNIGILLRRIGSKHPSHFAVMDFTAGYHQTPLNRDVRELTAFITNRAKYEWNRVPMGLKGATSYFQMLMTNLLGELVGEICEVYLDDIIVYAQSEAQLIERLELILAKIRAAKLVLSPPKCKFGKTEIGFLGHTINADGISFTRDQKDGVLKLSRPKSASQLRSFLGLCNVFRQHVEGHAQIVKPLNKLVGHKSAKRLEWTEEANRAFEEIRMKIDKCPALFFIDEVSPIYLMTDASDIGIGAYLYQTVEGVDKPIEFLSRAFDDTQRSWSTIEKECFAIHVALTKWDHLLRAARFTIRTDHKNLIYLTTSKSPKVERWKIFAQDFDFTLEHVAGKDNIAADSLSRLCSQLSTICCLTDEHDYLLCALKDNHSAAPIAPGKLLIIRQFHNSGVGHHGVDAVIAKLDTKRADGTIDPAHEWPQRRRDVRKIHQGMSVLPEEQLTSCTGCHGTIRNVNVPTI